MKNLKKSLVLISVVGILLLVGILGMILYTEHIDQSDQAAPYVVVLGARLYGDQPSPVLTERLRTALHYLNRYADARVIVSGAMDGRETITEAEAMRRWLIEQGIDPERIRLDEYSRNTFENLRNAKDIIHQEKGENRIAISTSGYHQLRAGFLAKRLGIGFIRLPADNPPSERFKAYGREVLAVIKSFLFDHE